MKLHITRADTAEAASKCFTPCREVWQLCSHSCAADTTAPRKAACGAHRHSGMAIPPAEADACRRGDVKGWNSHAGILEPHRPSILSSVRRCYASGALDAGNQSRAGAFSAFEICRDDRFEGGCCASTTAKSLVPATALLQPDH